MNDQKLRVVKSKVFGLITIVLVGISTLLLISCADDLAKDEEDEIPFPSPVPNEHDFVYSSEGVFTLAVFNTLLESAAVDKIKSDLALFQVDMPATLLAKWENDTIWVEHATQTIVYHPHSASSSRAGSVVIGHASNFVEDTKKKPSLLIHHLARAYYDKYLGSTEKADILNHYTHVKTVKYQKVYMSNGIKLVMDQVPDASKSVELYFAETSEAYFGENDYYPFDYQELLRYDPPMFNLLESVWGSRTVASNPHGISLPPSSLKQWLAGEQSDVDLYYRKYLDAGLPVLSSRFVSDEALVQAKYIVETMLKKIPESRDEQLKANFRIGIIGAYENVTDMPENRMMNVWWPDTDWDARGRGYGATTYLPLMTCGEENIIKIPNYTERYPHESIMVHEFAHNVDFGLRRGRPGFEDALIAAYNNAKNTGLWAGTYAIENDAEYFAEGAQAWFDTCNMYVMINGVNTKLKTREQLFEYDPVLYNLLETVFPKDKLTGYHFTYE